MNIKIVSFLVILVMLMGALSLYRYQRAPVTPGKVSVSTSFYPLYFLTSQIAGDVAEVTMITPAGAEPHDYEPTARDIATIEQSNLLVLLGQVEPWAPKIQDELRGAPVTILTVGDDLMTGTINEGGTQLRDPHVWLDPVLAQKMVETISSQLQTIDPAHVLLYQSKTRDLQQRLSALDTSYREGLASCAQRTIVTSHAAFGYLARRYGLVQMPIAGLSPDAEPSPGQMATISTFINDQHITVIFFERLTSPKIADTIASETGAKTLVLDPIEGLPDDQIKAGKTYFTQMEENLQNLRLALSCT